MYIDAAIEEKSAVNLRIRTSLKKKARDFGLNLSQTLEKTLAHEISNREQAAWVQENQQAIAAYNQRIEAHGPALSRYRSF